MDLKLIQMQNIFKDIDFRCEFYHWSFSFHQLRKLIVADISISVQISLLQYLIEVLFAELLAQFAQTFSKFFLWDETIVIFVKKFKHLLEIGSLISFPLIDLTEIGRVVPSNEGEKLVKFNGAGII